MDGIVFYLNGDRGIAVLEALVNSGHGVVLAVTTPGKAMSGPIFDTCRELDVPLQGVLDVNNGEFVSGLRELQPTIGVVGGFSTIFKQPLIEAPRNGTINLHGGRLPQYRGGSPLNWQIINGESQIGISIIRMDKGVDTGPLLGACLLNIDNNEDISAIHKRANKAFSKLTADVLSAMDRGEMIEMPQNDADGAYWHQRHPDDGKICFHSMTARQVHDLIRAISRPFPGAFAMNGAGLVRFWRSELPSRTIRGVPGRVCWLEGQGPYVICKDGAILAIDVEVDGGGRLCHGMHLT